MAGVKMPKVNVTPQVQKDLLIEQLEEQITVLYSQDATIWEKETASLNYQLLIVKYKTGFNTLPKLSKERGA